VRANHARRGRDLGVRLAVYGRKQVIVQRDRGRAFYQELSLDAARALIAGSVTSAVVVEGVVLDRDARSRRVADAYTQPVQRPVRQKTLLKM